MSALLTADEAARLVPGERLVIVRPGDPFKPKKSWPDPDHPTDEDGRCIRGCYRYRDPQHVRKQRVSQP